MHCPMGVHTWTGVFGVLGGHNDTAVCCKDAGPVWQGGWGNESCSRLQDEPSACPSLWGSVVGSSALCPAAAAENTGSTPLCPSSCGSDGLSRAGGDLCDP